MHATMWIKLENTVLVEIDHSQKTTYGTVPLGVHVYKPGQNSLVGSCWWVGGRGEGKLMLSVRFLLGVQKCSKLDGADDFAQRCKYI